MGYRIEYGGRPVIWNPGKVRWGRVLGYSVIFFAGVCLLSACFWPEGKDVLMDWLYPGNPDVTKQALRHMASSLRAGDPFGDAVLVFCRDILSGAKIPG